MRELVRFVSQRRDMARYACLGAGIDHAHGPGVDHPTEDLAVESRRFFFILAPNLEVNHRMGHAFLLARIASIIPS